MRKRRFLVLFSVIFVLLAVNVSALTPGPSCTVLEKPEELRAYCTGGVLVIEDGVESFTVLEAPEGVDIDFFVKYQFEFNSIQQEITDENEFFVQFYGGDDPSKLGVYLIRINNEYTIRVHHHGDGSNSKALFEGITLYGGIALLLAGLILTKRTKHKEKGKACILLGMLLLLIFLILLFTLA